MRAALVVCSVVLLGAGCSDGKSVGRASPPTISPALPSTPNTWRRYPRYPSASCWARPTTPPSITRAAPSLPVSKHTRPASPEKLVRRLLARLGDRSFIRGIDIDAPPPARLLRHVFPGEKPPANALWAYIDAPLASGQLRTRSSPENARAHALAQWEATLVGGALRDDFCSAGGRPLVGWTVSTRPIDGGVSDATFALNQHFPNLSRRQFRDRLALVGKQFGFEVESLRLLRPRELAPIVVVKTTRDRRQFISDVRAIIELLDPRSGSGHQSALTFEGFFEARDSGGPFVRVDNAWRGQVVGSEWSAEPGFYPYDHG